MKSVLCYAERLFGGFEESMQINIVMKDRKEVFNVRWTKLVFYFRIYIDLTNRKTVDQENTDGG